MENSAEYRTMIDLTSELRLAVRSELVTLTGSLLASRLISLDNDIEMRNTAHSEVERSAKLVELVQNKVRQNPRHYHSFIGILQGNQVQYRDILQRLEQTYQEQQKEDGMKYVDKLESDVISHIHDLEHQFRQVHENLLTELEDSEVSVKKLLRSLTLLPAEIRVDYMTAIMEMFPVLRRESTISDIFYHLSPLVDFLSYGLLKYIIDVFGSETLKKKIASYGDAILVFMKKTTVEQLMDIWPGQQEIPPNFSKLRAKIDENPSTYTLYELNQLRKRFCSGIKLTDVVFVLIGLETSNSFVVEWLIPSTFIPQLMEFAKKLDFGFYLREHILKMTVDDKQIFPMLPDAKPKIPPLKAAAATVTDLPEDQEPPVTELSSSVEQLSLSSIQEHRIRDELRDCALYSGVGVFFRFNNYMIDGWKPVKPHLSSSGYKIIPTLSLHLPAIAVDSPRLFTTIAQSIAYPKPLTAAKSSDSPPYVIAVFVSGRIVHYTSVHTLDTVSGPVNIVDDLIQPFLPQSAPHLQHIPKLFFITSVGNPDATPPHFPDDPDGNYCAACYVAFSLSHVFNWAAYISDNLFLSGMTIQKTIENSKSHLKKGKECLHYFMCLQNKSLVLK